MEMADGKRSFVLYSDLLPTIKKLVEKDRKNKTNNSGELFLHLLEYVCDNDPEPINDTVDLVFEPIKTQLKRDLTKWEDKSPQRVDKARVAGLASAEARRLKKELNPTNELKVELNPTKSTVNVSVNVSVSEKELLDKLNSCLLSEIKISNDTNLLEFKGFNYSITEKEKINLRTAIWFQKLFIKNLKEKNSPTTHQEKATYKNYVTPIRLMFDNDNVNQDQVKKAYEFLNSLEGEFWKKQILSTSKLRDKIPTLLIQKNSLNGKSEQQFASSTKKQAKFTIAGAEKTLAADAERRQQKMDSNNS